MPLCASSGQKVLYWHTSSATDEGPDTVNPAPPPRHAADAATDGGTPWLNSAEAAAHLRCSTRQLRREYLEGDLQFARRGNHVLFRKQWLDEHIEQKHPRAIDRRRSA